MGKSGISLCVDKEIKCQVGQVPQTARAVSGRARTRPCPGPSIPFLPAISVSWASRDLFPQSPSFLVWGTGAQRAQAWEGQMGRLARLRASSSWLTVSIHQQETASCWFWGLYKGLQSECVGPDASAQGQHWPSVTAAIAVAAEPVPALWCAGECAISTPCLRPGWALGQEGILGDSIWEGRLRSKHLDFGLGGAAGELRKVSWREGSQRELARRKPQGQVFLCQGQESWAVHCSWGLLCRNGSGAWEAR